ncbi:MAG: secondary thiamine-phosphate synthase enzyme YjbQ [Candidatus Pacebacteria bacterium]|nr:secondary thiamine-phosphate synthase enzyme YjbQ [Candidatus Paceibacterota bacterium]
MSFTIKTKGFCDVINITEKVEAVIKKNNIKEGAILIFVLGSTAGICAIEYEEGVIKDLKNVFEKIAPQDGKYNHEEAWHDGNGFSHIRAGLLKPSLTVPIESAKLLLGKWQQIVLVDFDNKPRERKIIVKMF